MNITNSIVQGVALAALLVVSTGCVVEPRNDYYDHDHHRYYHEHAWHECGDHDEHCH
jgi:hypothetical protein